MNSPRDDLYAVLALLGELDRVLSPLPGAPSEDVTAPPAIPPPLPPSTPGRGARGAGTPPAGAGKRGAALAAVTRELLPPVAPSGARGVAAAVEPKGQGRATGGAGGEEGVRTPDTSPEVAGDRPAPVKRRAAPEALPPPPRRPVEAVRNPDRRPRPAKPVAPAPAAVDQTAAAPIPVAARDHAAAVRPVRPVELAPPQLPTTGVAAAGAMPLARRVDAPATAPVAASRRDPVAGETPPPLPRVSPSRVPTAPAAPRRPRRRPDPAVLDQPIAPPADAGVAMDAMSQRGARAAVPGAPPLPPSRRRPHDPASRATRRGGHRPPAPSIPDHPPASPTMPPALPRLGRSPGTRAGARRTLDEARVIAALSGAHDREPAPAPFDDDSLDDDAQADDLAPAPPRMSLRGGRTVIPPPAFASSPDTGARIAARLRSGGALDPAGARARLAAQWTRRRGRRL